MTTLRRIPWEALTWLAGLVALALYSPGEGVHFTLCPIRNAGLDGCPGCGLGHAVSYLFHGEISRSLSAHPLGLFAVIVLSYRIVQLTKPYLLNLWQK